MHYSLAPEVQTIAETLIRDHHRHLFDVRIDYLFVDTTPKAKGAEVWGSCRKITGLSAFLARQYTDAQPVSPDEEAFFVIVIAWPIWDTLSPAQQRALVDHELCHATVAKDGTLTLRTHDVEEFTAIIRRHGLWSEGVQAIAQVMQQGELFEPRAVPLLYTEQGA